MKKKCLLLALLFLSAIHFQIQITLGVPGDSFSDPITAYTGTNYGSITGSESEYFWLATSGEYEFSLTGPSGTDFDMKVYDGNQNQIGSATSTSYPDVVNASSNNGFYVRVYPYSGSGSFALNIVGSSFGESFDNPIIANLGNNYGEITTVQTSVYYWFSSTGEYDFTLTGPSGTDLDMRVYDGNQNQIGSATSTSYPDYLTVSSTNGFYIRIYQYSGTGSFTLNIEVATLPGESFAHPLTAHLGNNQGELSNQFPD
ncbi:MAG: hypothetical protein OEY49_20445, partial [Candidatus Heimdallarchaeota archaeon]|nr:hypothetical protein [Candidatus Heimdallarchaeota archaeon]